ncbi:hypothetical protein K437DRAFT_261644 [Tilletiaria anomala UBC 951]|uniref:Macrofage activating glyco protein n=1 Tax=Tilletiaria anomala (strain ATCC 24038 / CBS 436.72 / UBC 951) TaxID=1037660 RepID=A0A066WN90_TILAU|nr:uncharacterized protein K437DRAFT_261644 [Tilletiaria anomala UBC 951]KDN52095.1 hypothetical protein K437DRAFT_261644 [Tilletiaria anomala UBC 951]
MIASASKIAVGLIALAGLVEAQSVPRFVYGTPNPNAPGVKSRNKNGATNPKSAQLNTPINQTSVSRLASINSIDDWCTFGPEPVPNTQQMGDIEQTTVAYCTKARNNARVIPDGTLTAVHFVKTPLYVQVMALGDFTKINMAPGDLGGELDPHGATNMGNPVGGNVTSNVADGKTDVFYQEWMNYISSSQVCFRVCIAGTDIAPTPLECQHQLDTMGCNWVMPGNYADNSFDTCDGDAAYPPGLYPQPDGSTSTFQQFFTGTYVGAGGSVISYTNGSPTQTTPQSAYSLPSTSNCVTTSSISNGIKAIMPTTTMSTAVSSSTSSSSGSSNNNSSGGSSSSSSFNSGASRATVAASFVAAIGLFSAALMF